MSWSDDQCAEIVRQYWEERSAYCPDDKSLLNVKLYEQPDSYLLIADCPRCGSTMQKGRDADPLHDKFRAWTDDEKKQLVDKYFQKRHASCPVCRVALKMQSAPTFDTNYVSIRCVRCGNFHQAEIRRR